MPTPTTVLFDFALTLFATDPDVWVGGAATSIGRQLEPDEPTRISAAFADRVRATAMDPAHVARDFDPAAHAAGILAILHAIPGVEPCFAEALGAARLASWEPYADVRDTLTALRARGIRIGVVSNIGFDIRPIFARHRLDEFVDAFTLSCEVGCGKPDPAIWHAALRALAADPARTLMVGDHPAADGSAVSAGITALVLPLVPSPRLARGLHHVLALVDGGAARP